LRTHVSEPASGGAAPERASISTASHLPNLVVIGAMKCGTSSLHRYLSHHPEIFMSRKKELCFFAERWDHGIGWYREQFPEAAPIRGESSPNYTKYPAFADVPARMHTVLGDDIKLVYVVRDPIARIVSHYVDAYSHEREHRSLDDALEDLKGNHYVNCSRYAMQLDQYLAFFPLSRMLVVSAEDLRDRRREALARIFRFLGVDASFWCPEHEEVVNAGSDRRKRNALGAAATRAARRLNPVPLAVEVEPQPRRHKRLIGAYVSLTSRRIEAPQLGELRRRELVSLLREDADRLRELSGLALESWPV
jgi:sulfotransferase family protein